ncbi:MAG: GH39 family glycosyl hydrolase, partial [Rubrivivax sp.]
MNRRDALQRVALAAIAWASSTASMASDLEDVDTAPGPEVPLPSVFGIGASSVHNRTVNTLDRWLPKIQQLGIDNHRTVSAWWPTLEPQPDNWFWSVFDDQMAYLQQRDIWFGILLMGTPAWNTQDEPRSLPVNNLQGWARYVSQVAHRAKGRATHLEVWNEPPNGTGAKQTPADYARIVRATHAAAKAVDKRFQVGLAAKSAHILYLEQVIKAGARAQFDYVVLHPYESLNATMRSTGGDRVFASIVPTLRKMLAKMSPTRRDAPVFFTEIGATSELGERFQADALIKAYILGLVQGVSVIQWFEGMDGDSGPLG